MSSLTRYSDSVASYWTTTEPHTSYLVWEHTLKLFPTKQHLFVDDCNFHLYRYLKSKNVPVKSEGFQPLKWEQDDRQKPGDLSPRLLDGVLSFTYEGTQFEVFRASWKPAGQSWLSPKTYHFVFSGEDNTAGMTLVRHVYEWMQKLKGEIWEYAHGHWHKSKALYDSIQKASWDEVVMEKEFAKSLRSDTETFFTSKKEYDDIGVAWKRGILLFGPPGNGKTQTIQALIKDLGEKGIPSLYVKTFRSDRQGDEERGVSLIFKKAREESPCVLILEDLDALLQPKVKSYFLNELDGMARNNGILTIATSNHPDKIDDAILRRPSRFDQKYTFELPSFTLREEFATRWLMKVQERSGFSFCSTVPELAKRIAEKTEEWSFAFLKELFMSFLLRSATDRTIIGKRDETLSSKGEQQSSNEQVLMHQLDALAEQVKRQGKKAADGTEGVEEKDAQDKKAEDE